MFSLFFSLSSSFLFIALCKENKCLNSIKKENNRLHSENFLSQLQQILEKSNCSLPDLNEIYFTSNPSGQTGLRVTLSFLATLQILNPKIKLFHIDTLLLQAENDNCISLLTIDSRGNKYYGGVYQKKKCLLKSQIILKENLEELTKKFPNFSLRKDFCEIDFLTNFQILKEDFCLLNKIGEIDY
jgi:tRNA threonylcarbamoyladenosine biosynthesis protein TsaB